MNTYITQVTHADGTIWDGPIIYAATIDDAMLALPEGVELLGMLVYEEDDEVNPLDN